MRKGGLEPPRVFSPQDPESPGLAPWSRVSRENVGFGWSRATLQGVPAADNGTTAHNAPVLRLRISRLGERALAATVGRNGGAITPLRAGLSQPRTPSVEVMTRAGTLRRRSSPCRSVGCDSLRSGVFSMAHWPLRGSSVYARRRHRSALRAAASRRRQCPARGMATARLRRVGRQVLRCDPLGRRHVLAAASSG